MDSDAIYKWLDDLARYFENRDTGGEDRAHWANVYNAENALKVKAALVASEAEVERLREALKDSMDANFSAHSFLDANDPVEAVLVHAAGVRALAALTGEKK